MAVFRVETELDQNIVCCNLWQETLTTKKPTAVASNSKLGARESRVNLNAQERPGPIDSYEN